MSEPALPKVGATEAMAAAAPYVAGTFSIAALTSVIQLVWAGAVGGAWPAELSLDQAAAIAVLVSWVYTRFARPAAPPVTEPAP